MLWFVPLRMARGGPMPEWCQRFIFLILCGADLRATRDLLADNPFIGCGAGGAPTYVRVSLFDYHLSNCSHSRGADAQPQRAALERHRAMYHLNAESGHRPEEASSADLSAAPAQWEGDRSSSAWWRRQFVREIGCFTLGKAQGAEKSSETRTSRGADIATMSSLQRMEACKLEKVASLS